MCVWLSIPGNKIYPQRWVEVGVLQILQLLFKETEIFIINHSEWPVGVVLHFLFYFHVPLPVPAIHPEWATAPVRPCWTCCITNITPSRVNTGWLLLSCPTTITNIWKQHHRTHLTRCKYLSWNFTLTWFKYKIQEERGDENERALSSTCGAALGSFCFFAPQRQPEGTLKPFSLHIINSRYGGVNKKLKYLPGGKSFLRWTEVMRQTKSDRPDPSFPRQTFPILI